MNNATLLILGAMSFSLSMIWLALTNINDTLKGIERKMKDE